MKNKKPQVGSVWRNVYTTQLYEILPTPSPRGGLYMVVKNLDTGEINDCVPFSGWQSNYEAYSNP